VDNLGGRLVNGTSDDHAWLFVLAVDGTLRWSRRLGPAPASGMLVAEDLDRDGRPEILVSAPLPELGAVGLAVLDGDGEVLATHETGLIANGLVMMRDTDGSALAVLGLGRSLVRFRVDRQSITREAEVLCAGRMRPALAADLVDAPGQELLASDLGKRSWLLGADLEPLAMLEGTELVLDASRVRLITDGTGRQVVRNLGTNQHPRVRLAFAANDRPFPWALVLTAGGLGGGALLGWRRRARPHSEATVRELRLQLLGRLQLSGHGAIGALSSLRRFNWHLETVMQGFDADERVIGLFRDLSDDTLRMGLPGLTAATELAELAGMDEDTVRGARTAVRRLHALLTDLAETGFATDALRAAQPDLQEAATQAEQGFKALRRAVEAGFRTDPHPVFTRSLAASDLDGVTVQDALDGVPACRMDDEELAFIVDNLVENALRAMRGSPERVLTLAWHDAGEHVVLTVTDTGCGIAPDETATIMTPGHSNRRGGGLGLPRSQELLGKYGGSLTVKDSRPGGGTTMALLLPRAEA
jgi:signal transduction histidine kinase